MWIAHYYNIIITEKIYLVNSRELWAKRVQLTGDTIPISVSNSIILDILYLTVNLICYNFNF